MLKFLLKLLIVYQSNCYILRSFGPFIGKWQLKSDRKVWRESGYDMQQRATGWNQTLGYSGKDGVFGHRVHNLFSSSSYYIMLNLQRLQIGFI